MELNNNPDAPNARNKKTIGIPRTLFYFKHPELWASFFEELGVKVILSDSTNREVLDDSLKLSDNESCLSVKLFAGHINNLKGKCDLMFVPKFSSEKKGYFSCPKFLILPHLGKLFTDYSKEIISQEFNSSYFPKKLSLFMLGLKFSHNPLKIYKAADIAIKKEKEKIKAKTEDFNRKISSNKMKLLVISHPYIIYDTYMNLDLFKKLDGLGVTSIVIDEVPYREKDTYVKWDFANQFLNSLDYLSENGINIDGILQISNFNCGCDSVVVDVIKEKISGRNIHYLNLIIDEHTGEAGIITRLEAFVDSINGVKNG